MRGHPIIQVQNFQRKLKVNAAGLQAFAMRALPLCLALPGAAPGALRGLREVTVALVSDRRMAALHRQFLQIAGPTDVLTFQHGEIVVSVETAQRNAVAFGSSLEAEIRLYIVHGFLHLLGFDDTTPAQAKAMETAQRRVLRATKGPGDP